jgi:hypothetical protein
MEFSAGISEHAVLHKKAPRQPGIPPGEDVRGGGALRTLGGKSSEGRVRAGTVLDVVDRRCHLSCANLIDDEAALLLDTSIGEHENTVIRFGEAL